MSRDRTRQIVLEDCECDTPQGDVPHAYTIRRHALSGLAHVNSESAIFQKPGAIPMLIDVFAERGFNAAVHMDIQEVPQRFDLTTGEITCRSKVVYRVRLQFTASKIRRG